jgi:hypothetical protein
MAELDIIRAGWTCVLIGFALGLLTAGAAVAAYTLG